MQRVVTPDKSVLKERLRQSLGAKRQQRGRTKTRQNESATPTPARPSQRRELSPTTINMTMRRFPAWIMEQLHESILKTIESFAILVHFNLENYAEIQAPEFRLGTRIDMLMLKLNGAVYYEASAHMNGIKHDMIMGRQLEAHPGRIIEIIDRDIVDVNHILHFQIPIERLIYVGSDKYPNGIPGEWVRDRIAFPILPNNPSIFVLKISTGAPPAPNSPTPQMPSTTPTLQ